MRDYLESATTGQTDRRTERQTDAGQNDPYVPLCFAGDIKIPSCLPSEPTFLFCFSFFSFGDGHKYSGLGMPENKFCGRAYAENK